MKFFYALLILSGTFTNAYATENESCVQRTNDILSQTIESVGTCSSARSLYLDLNDAGQPIYTAASDLSVRYKVRRLVVVEDRCNRRVLHSETLDETRTETKTFQASETTGYTNMSSALIRGRESAESLCESYRASQL